MKIRDIMRVGPYTIHDTDKLGDAQRLMTRSRVRHLPVLKDSKLIGILSERDVLAARASTGPDQDWWTLPVSDAMKSPVQTANPDDPVIEVAGRMAAAKIGAMPIVELGKLIGLATATDVLDAEVRAAMAPAHGNSATAADAMTAWPHTIAPDALLSSAIDLMARRHVRHLPVVDAASGLIGILSDRDVRTAIGDPAQYLAQLRTASPRYRVQDVMTRPAIPVPFDRPLVDVARIFATDRVEALPVTDKFGALIGILSYVDALRVLAA